MPTFDHSTFLAHRASVAAEPSPPGEIVLPGAKVAIPHDRLLAYHDAGIGEDEIRSRTNARWEADNAGRLAAHAAWTQGPYRNAIEDARNMAMRQAAEDMRRRALLEQKLAEWSDTREGEGD